MLREDAFMPANRLDIADSFDYRNKYAIIEYLRDISDVSHFSQIILTHNFDFFRTIQSRFVHPSNCFMAFKTEKGLLLDKAEGVTNIFVKDWKKEFFSDPKKKVASIPFIRNMIEYTRGPTDPEYTKLTSLLHWKPDTGTITIAPAPLTESYADTLRQVTVTLAWNSGSALRSRTMTTLVSKYGIDTYKP